MRKRGTGYWISLTAVAIATAVLFIALGLQCAVQHEIGVLLDQIGANVFYIHAEDHSMLDETDRSRIASLPEVALVAGEGSIRTSRIPDATLSLTYFQVGAEYFSLMRLPLARGEAFERGTHGVAVLGSDVARAVFGTEDPIGQSLEGLRIIGVLDALPAGDSIRAPLNSRVLVPVGSAPGPAELNQGAPYWALWIRASGSVSAAVRAIHSQFPGMAFVLAGDRYSWAFSMEESVNHLLAFTSLGLLVLAGTIVSGMLSLSAISRRREIGIRLAIGARQRTIATLLLTDALRLTAQAGLVGSAMGLAAFAVSKVFGASLRLGTSHLVIAPLLFLLALTASFLPGWRTARLSPVDALMERGMKGKGRRGTRTAFFIVTVSAAIGTLSLYAFLSLGDGAKHVLRDYLGGAGEQFLSASAPDQSILAPPTLSPDDANPLREITGVERVVPIGKVSVLLPWNRSRSKGILAANPGYADLRVLPIAAGRDLSSDEVGEGTPVAVVSSDVVDDLAESGDPIGQVAWIAGKSFTIVGVFSAGTVAIPLGVWAVVPYIAYSEFWRDYDDHMFWLRAEPEADLAAIAEYIVEAMHNRHPGRAEVSILIPEALASENRDILSGIALRLLLLISVAFALGAANTLNLIRFHLAQQLRELAIRRALGATSGSILWIGISHGLGIAVSAAALGLVGAVPISRFVSRAMQIPVPIASLRNAVVSSAVTLVVGLFAGSLAGRIVMRDSPADALRKGRR